MQIGGKMWLCVWRLKEGQLHCVEYSLTSFWGRYYGWNPMYN